MEKVEFGACITESNIKYSFMITESKAWGISKQTRKNYVFYAFDPEEKEYPKVNKKILEESLKALLKYDIGEFDAFILSFEGLKNAEKYPAIALKVFKDYWNELYNSVIADTAFERDMSFDSIEKTYDFWNENKE